MLTEPAACQDWQAARRALDAALADPGVDPQALAALGRAEHAAWLALHHHPRTHLVAHAIQPPAFVVGVRVAVGGPPADPPAQVLPPPNRLYADPVPLAAPPPDPPVVLRVVSRAPRRRTLDELVATLARKHRDRAALTAAITQSERELTDRIHLALERTTNDYHP